MSDGKAGVPISHVGGACKTAHLLTCPARGWDGRAHTHIDI